MDNCPIKVGIKFLMSKKVSVRVVSLGDQRQPIDFSYLRAWSSELFEIVECSTVENQPDAAGGDWEYLDSQLESVVPTSTSCDLTLIIVAAPLEANYYVRRLSQNRAAVSLYEMSSILVSNNFKIESFLLQRVYALAIYLLVGDMKLPQHGDLSLSHHAIRGCLFDMNANKGDIVFSMHKPTLCAACQSKIGTTPLPQGFLSTICAELKAIRRPLYFRIAEWGKAHPILALTAAAFASLLINVLSNSMFEKLKRIWPLIA